MTQQLTAILLIYGLATFITVTLSLPVLDITSGIDNATIEELRSSVNESGKNLYVVRAVVYEVGILTEVDDNETSFESQERVDLTFFDAHSNSSHINLGNIPLPIQTNVTGQVFTGIAPVNIGAFNSPADLLNSLPLTGTIVNITHSNTALYQLTKSNVSSAEKPQVIDERELGSLPTLANLLPLSSIVNRDDNIETVENGAISASNSIEISND